MKDGCLKIGWHFVWEFIRKQTFYKGTTISSISVGTHTTAFQADIYAFIILENHLRELASIMRSVPTYIYLFILIDWLIQRISFRLVEECYLIATQTYRNLYF